MSTQLKDRTVEGRHVSASLRLVFRGSKAAEIAKQQKYQGRRVTKRKLHWSDQHFIVTTQDERKQLQKSLFSFNCNFERRKWNKEQKIERASGVTGSLRMQRRAENRVKNEPRKTVQRIKALTTRFPSAYFGRNNWIQREAELLSWARMGRREVAYQTTYGGFSNLFSCGWSHCAQATTKDLLAALISIRRMGRLEEMTCT